VTEPCRLRAHEPVHGVGEPEPGVKGADPVEGGPSNEQGRGREARHRLRGARVAFQALALVRHGSFPEHLHVGHAKVEPGVVAETLHLKLELVRMPEIIGIEERQERAARGAGAEVAGRRRPQAPLSHDTDAITVRARDVDAVVVGAVVGDDDLDRRVALVQHAGQRVPQEAAGVEHGDDAADEQDVATHADHRPRAATGCRRRPAWEDRARAAAPCRGRPRPWERGTVVAPWVRPRRKARRRRRRGPAG